QNERPPNAPEDELGEDGDAAPDMCGAVGQGQESRHRNEHKVDADHGPLQPPYGGLVAHEPVADTPGHSIAAPRHARDRHDAGRLISPPESLGARQDGSRRKICTPPDPEYGTR